MIGEWLPNLLTGWGVQLLGVLSPGPGVALILTVATTRGRAPALATCLGIALGAVLLALIAVLGLAALLADIAWAMTAVRFAGAAFLLWLAWKSFGRMMAPGELPAAKGTARADNSAAAGFAMQMTNPKAILYWIAAAAVAGLETAPLPILALFLGGAFVNSFAGHGAWAVALSSRPFLSLYAGARRWIEGVLGVFFAFAAFKLATARE
ncbi:LysE family translocator [Silicimonas algicola]|uniref:Threonine/homoserine/homoserine lactone efflux protein n=1 Tax=Silicimonas algicola TaxID=1826607 RepID=A0A316G7Q6_9RHOB|nr:LysE family translocator [Silicimonas algicola]AZQ68924.1 LysE family translocator [Silicimonas algicola]PWK55976.1 threonine/homoserine/homoserine lactone efflux protein [Silicimonas algicola]